VVALDLPRDQPVAIPVAGVFTDGQTVREWYSGQAAVVAGGKVRFAAASPVALVAAD
jgi:alpha-amylase